MEDEKPPEDDDSKNLFKIMELAGSFNANDGTSLRSTPPSSKPVNDCKVTIKEKEKEASVKLDPVPSEESSAGFTFCVPSGGKDRLKTFVFAF